MHGSHLQPIATSHKGVDRRPAHAPCVLLPLFTGSPDRAFTFTANATGGDLWAVPGLPEDRAAALAEGESGVLAACFHSSVFLIQVEVRCRLHPGLHARGWCTGARRIALPSHASHPAPWLDRAEAGPQQECSDTTTHTCKPPTLSLQGRSARPLALPAPLAAVAGNVTHCAFAPGRGDTLAVELSRSGWAGPARHVAVWNLATGDVFPGMERAARHKAQGFRNAQCTLLPRRTVPVGSPLQ